MKKLFGLVRGARNASAPTLVMGRARLRTLLFARWLAIAGQVATLLVVQFRFGIDLPLDAAMAVVGLSVVLNLVLTLFRPAAMLGERGVRALLGWDTLQLGALLFLTGGLTNPFSILLLAPIAISATILGRRSTLILCVLCAAVASFVAIWHEPLPWLQRGGEIPLLYVAGIWTALLTATVFIALYAGAVAAESRQIQDALAATQLALAREQRLAAVGSLAAAAAHELGTPLGTITVVAREIAREMGPDAPLAEDMRVLLSETERCRQILVRLAQRPEADADGLIEFPPISELARRAAAPYEGGRVPVTFSSAGEGPEPHVHAAPELVQGVATLIENATQFARRSVAVDAGWDRLSVELSIADDGPGFAPGVLDRLGEPYLSVRTREQGGEGLHMGLGVFIATTLLERTGAVLSFANRPQGGALVQVRWPRARVESAKENRQ